MKGLFLCLGLGAAVVWLGLQPFTTHPPQVLITVCAFGVLRLKRHQVVGGACLAGLIWDLFDWQVRLGFHSAVLGFVAWTLSSLQEHLDTDQLLSLVVSGVLFTWLVAFVSPLAGRLFGCMHPLPAGWWYQSLFVEPLYQAAFALWLGPFRRMGSSPRERAEEPSSSQTFYLTRRPYHDPIA